MVYYSVYTCSIINEMFSNICFFIFNQFHSTRIKEKKRVNNLDPRESCKEPSYNNHLGKFILKKLCFHQLSRDNN